MSQHIVFLDRGTIGPGVDIRAPDFKYTWVDYDKTDPAETVERIGDADICITNKVPITAAVVEQCPRLKLVALAATGSDRIDIDACRAFDVTVSNIRNYANKTVPEHTFALILALRRNLVEYRQHVQEGRWQDVQQFCFFNRPVRDLHGSTLGVLGTGDIAQATGTLGKAFGMSVQYHSLSGRVDFPERIVTCSELLESSDILTLHCPLNRQSRGLIGKTELETMKPNALLINTARGGIVDEDALYNALVEAVIGGAGVDVATQEPPRRDSAVMKMTVLPNCIVTPHTAWASVEAMQAVCDQLIDNIEAFVAGQPRNTL